MCRTACSASWISPCNFWRSATWLFKISLVCSISDWICIFRSANPLSVPLLSLKALLALHPCSALLTGSCGVCAVDSTTARTTTGINMLAKGLRQCVMLRWFRLRGRDEASGQEFGLDILRQIMPCLGQGAGKLWPLPSLRLLACWTCQSWQGLQDLTKGRPLNTNFGEVPLGPLGALLRSLSLGSKHWVVAHAMWPRMTTPLAFGFVVDTIATQPTAKPFLGTRNVWMIHLYWIYLTCCVPDLKLDEWISYSWTWTLNRNLEPLGLWVFGFFNRLSLSLSLSLYRYIDTDTYTVCFPKQFTVGVLS